MNSFFITVMLLALISLVVFAFVRKNRKRNLLTALVVAIVSFIGVGITAPKTTDNNSKHETEKVVKKEAKKSTSKSEPKKKKINKKKATKKHKKNRSNTYEIDKIVKNTDVSNPSLMTFDEFSNFVVGRFSLESAIAKYGMPTHSIGGAKGDVAIEVTFPTEEKGYSADLHFEPNKKNGFSDWVLSKKESVKTSGIEFDKYTKP